MSRANDGTKARRGPRARTTNGAGASHRPRFVMQSPGSLTRADTRADTRLSTFAQQLGVRPAVAEVDHHADREPDHKSEPIERTEAEDHRAADDNAERRDHGHG